MNRLVRESCSGSLERKRSVLPRVWVKGIVKIQLVTDTNYPTRKHDANGVRTYHILAMIVNI